VTLGGDQLPRLWCSEIDLPRTPLKTHAPKFMMWFLLQNRTPIWENFLVRAIHSEAPKGVNASEALQKGVCSDATWHERSHSATMT